MFGMLMDSNFAVDNPNMNNRPGALLFVMIEIEVVLKIELKQPKCMNDDFPIYACKRVKLLVAPMTNDVAYTSDQHFVTILVELQRSLMYR